MGKTGISWTDEVWNTTKGCSRISEGCQHCYAEVQAARIVRMGKGKPTPYDGLVRVTAGGEARWTGKVTLHPDVLALPLRWRAARRIFVDSMSDLFHESLTNEQIAAVFGVMTACPQHTFQVLTKRARRMREWFEWVAAKRTPLITIPHSPRLVCRCEADKILNPDASGRPLGTESQPLQWPLPNVWLGVSVENQAAADERIPELLRAPAAVRFLSCEPLIGPVEIQHMRGWLAPFSDEHHSLRGQGFTRISWVIGGCESGPRARPCSVEWLRSLRDQCASAGVAYFLKQAEESIDDDNLDGTLDAPIECMPEGAEVVSPCSRKGRGPGGNSIIERPFLDGRQHLEFPAC